MTPMGAGRARPPGGPDQPEGPDLIAFVADQDDDPPPPAVAAAPTDTIPPELLPADDQAGVEDP